MGLDHRTDDIRAGLEAAAPDGLDVYFDNVGGEQLVAAVQSMRPHGRVALCGMISSVVGGAPQPGLDRLMDLILRRVQVADGRTRAFVNDQPVSVQVLKAIGATLVEIHGQHDDRGLLSPAGHRALLDAFGRVDTRATAGAWTALREAEDALANARAEIETAARDRDWLEHAVAELTALAPEPGEEELLADRRRRDAWLAQRLRELTPEERAVLRDAAPLIQRLATA